LGNEWKLGKEDKMKKFAVIDNETNKVVDFRSANNQSDLVVEEGKTYVEVPVAPRPGYTYENGVFASQE